MLGAFNCTCISVKCIRQLVPHIDKHFRMFKILYSTDSNDDKSNIKVKLPEVPQNCCMSGCANCVWVTYAEEVAKIINDGGETAKQKILEHVKEPNLRAFLMLELHDLFKKEEQD